MRVAVEGRTLPARSARQDEAELARNLFLTLRTARQRASCARSAPEGRGRGGATESAYQIRLHPSALSVLPPAVTGLASTSAKAIWHGSVPLLTQLWMVPRWTSTSPALRWTLVPSSSMSISPFI